MCAARPKFHFKISFNIIVTVYTIIKLLLPSIQIKMVYLLNPAMTIFGQFSKINTSQVKGTTSVTHYNKDSLVNSS